MAAALAGAVGVPRGTFAGSDRADVALVLAVDVSGSVDDHRFKLQREGIAAALESEEVATAVSIGVNGTIEIAVVEWAEEQRLLVPWTILRGRDDLKTLATRLRGALLGTYDDRSWRRHRCRRAPIRRAAPRQPAAGYRCVGRRPAKHRRGGDGGCARCCGVAWAHRERPAYSLRRGTRNRGLVSRQCGRGPRRVSHRRRQLRCICGGLPTEAGARSRRVRPGLEDGGGVDPAILPGDRLSTESRPDGLPEVSGYCFTLKTQKIGRASC